MKTAHGHQIIEVTGLGLTGSQEIKRLTEKGCKTNLYFGSHVEYLLDKERFHTAQEFNEKHLLDTGRAYKIGLVLGNELEKHVRSTRNILEIAERCGYKEAPAGVIPRLCEMMLEEKIWALLKELGISIVTTLNSSPVEGYAYSKHALLAMHMFGETPRLDHHEFNRSVSLSECLWDNGEAFAFCLPENRS